MPEEQKEKTSITVWNKKSEEIKVWSFSVSGLSAVMINFEMMISKEDERSRWFATTHIPL